MKTRLLVLAGFAALLLNATEGRTQPGGPGGPPNAPDFRGGGRGGPGGGNFDPGQFFDQLANGKDVWNRAETEPRFQRMFDRVASTLGITNGQITRQQFMAYQDQRAAQRRGGRRGNDDSTAEGMFARLDTNGDGVLNFDEMPPDLRSERELWDKDKNGMIDLQEFKAYYQARIQPPQPAQQASGGANNQPQDQQWPGYYYWDYAPQAPAEEERKPPVVYRPGKLPKELPAWFTQIDTDQDGQIGLYEWKASGRTLQEFDEIDRNKDGFLTVDEVLRFVNKGKEGNGQSGSQQGYASGSDFGGNWGRGFGPPGFGGPGFRRGFGPGFGPGGSGPPGGDRGFRRGGGGGRNRDRGGGGDRSGGDRNGGGD